MSSNLFTPSTPLTLSLNLDDGAMDFYPRASVFGGGAVVDTVDLVHVGLGRYAATWTPGALLSYDVLFLVCVDVARTVESGLYTRELERWQSDAIIASAISLPTLPASIADQVWDELLTAHAISGSAGEFLARLTAARSGNIDDSNTRVRLVEKIWRNRLELEDGDSGNWVLYDDDSVTPLLTWSVTDKTDGPITQQIRTPSRRTRGV